MDIEVAKLRTIADKLFNHLMESGREIVSLPTEYYWSIPRETLYDPYNQPSELTLGQLSEDLSELKRIESGEAEPLSYALVWLAAVLRAIGDETVS